MTGVLAAVLAAAGTVVAVLASLMALRPRVVYTRLHYLTAITSVAGPLVGIGLAIVNGPGLTTASVLLIIVLQAVSAPVLGIATGRLNAQRDDLVEERSPE